MSSITIKGVQDELEIFEDRLVITPKGVLGFLNKGMKGSKEIPFSSITAIQVKEAGSLVNGYIQFSMHGGRESKSGILSATSDENTFMFPKKVNEEVKKAREFIRERMGHKPQQSTSASSLADEIAKLKSLMDSGALTQEEFEKMKSNLISKAS
ncbi:MAG: SHOCT domain-containing protein [Bdellovibrionales bacterium]|nr:SHOCT domain-containing protein [Bdellovibrionales bacterium]